MEERYNKCILYHKFDNRHYLKYCPLMTARVWKGLREDKAENKYLSIPHEISQQKLCVCNKTLCTAV